MHKILDSFLSEHISPPGHEADETTRRELKIIELLKSKSLSVAAGEPLHSPPHGRAKRELEDEGGTGSGGRISALRTVPVPVPRPRAGSFGGVGNTLTSPGFHGSETMGDNSAQSSPQWTTAGMGTPGHSHRPKRSATGNASLDEDANGGTSTLSPLESSSSSSAAQRLLDNWVNNAQMDSVGTGTFGLSSLDPNLQMMGGTNIGMAGGGWLGLDGSTGPMGDVSAHGPTLIRSDSADLLGAASSGLGDPSAVDWNYWENLIEQIRAAGGSA